MKRKRDQIDGQGSKKLRANPSSDVFRLKVASKLSSLLNASLSELGQKTESLSASDKLLKRSRPSVLTVTVKPEPSSEQEDLDPLTKSLLNFIDSAKIRLSELFQKENEDCEKILGGQSKCSPVTSDSLQAQISEKIRSLCKKALSTDILTRSAGEKESTNTEVQIVDEVEIINEELQNASVVLENFLKSARKKVNALLSTKRPRKQNNKLVSVPHITESQRKKHTGIPNSKCINSVTCLSEPKSVIKYCSSVTDNTQVIGNSLDNLKVVRNQCSSEQVPVLTQTTKLSLRSPKTILVDSKSVVHDSIDNSSIKNKSSDKCVTNHHSEFVKNLSIETLKLDNQQCARTLPSHLGDKSALAIPIGSSRPFANTGKNCSLRKSSTKTKLCKSSTTGLNNIVEHQFTKNLSTDLNPAKNRHQNKCKTLVDKSHIKIGRTIIHPSTNKSFLESYSQRKFPTEVQSSKECSERNSEFLKNKIQASFKKLNNTVAMDFGIPFESNSFEEPSNYSFESLDYGTGSGILLMDEAEHAPDVLNLEVVIDERTNSDESSSEPEVLCLGEKVPTYEVVTIDEEEEVSPVAPAGLASTTSSRNEGVTDEKIFECPHCGKGYKVESLLKFHVRMHVSSDVQDHTIVEEDRRMPTSQEDRSQEKKKMQQKTKKPALEKESSGSNMKIHKKKSSRRHKSRHVS